MLSFKSFINEEANFITEMAIAIVGGEENYGTLDELSKKKLGQYINKASLDAGEHGHSLGHAKATQRLTKEDFDAILQMVENSTELNELSKKKLGQYINKAHRDVIRTSAQRTIDRRDLNGMENQQSSIGIELQRHIKNANRILDNRETGTRKAVRRLTKLSTSKMFEDVNETLEMTPPPRVATMSYDNPHSLHDKAMQHNQLATQASNRMFDESNQLSHTEEAIEKTLYHAHQAKYHGYMAQHSYHNKDTKTGNLHIKAQQKHMQRLGIK